MSTGPLWGSRNNPRLYWRRRPLALSRMYVQGQPRRVLRIGVWLIVRQVPCRVSKSKDLQLGTRGALGADVGPSFHALHGHGPENVGQSLVSPKPQLDFTSTPSQLQSHQDVLAPAPRSRFRPGAGSNAHASYFLILPPATYFLLALHGPTPVAHPPMPIRIPLLDVFLSF